MTPEERAGQVRIKLGLATRHSHSGGITMTLFTEPATEASGSTISECGTYRYHLWRQWDDLLPILVYVMQNPSTADASTDDPTIRKCITIAKNHGYGGISVRNVFALRATDERELLTHPDPFGPENENHLGRARNVSLLTRLVVAWGNRFGGARLDRHYKKASLILSGLSPYCLGVNKSGEPKHPLFLRNKVEMQLWLDAKRSL